ncbi:hypothetical protein Aph02nite_60810 [Actinoplanes philippinensis]|uniref:DUF5667 domain-containing protein n=1 Tax=Actinoplanes philippinensis TaxID=35752 RepID=A0A1I2JHY5_9ACTN|nr:DUF5667 domain-containing protein [Actinoplanes philippinensis]GIE80131.1 hypothetical protein Aph02nite_60810 [Actinoplanes philippinensis]SFF53708.1 hypothetical protein SAMN05421541_112292 [Actinoplanes philippinensis]
MKFAFPNSRSAERFAELLDDAGGARRHHSRGQADEELNRLVAISNRLSTARPGAPVDSEFRVGLRAMLVATAERDGIGLSDAEADPEPVAEPVVRRPLFGRRIRARGAIVIGVAAGAMAVSGISAASESASPGEMLYSVKRQTERAQLAIAGSDVTRGQLSLDFARTRLSEAMAMNGDEPGLALVLDDMDADTRKGVRLLTTSAVSQQDTKPLATLDDFVDDQRTTFTPALERLSAPNRDRATLSLGLLEDVVKRAETLRTGLACDKVTPAGSDALGPKLRDCAAEENRAAEPSGTSPQSGSGTKAGTRQNGPATAPKPAKSSAAAAPGATGQSVKPNKSAAATATPAVTDGVAPMIDEEPVDPQFDPLDEPDGGLGGLLGDLF